MTRSDMIAAVTQLTGFRKKDIETMVAAVAQNTKLKTKFEKSKFA